MPAQHDKWTLDRLQAETHPLLAAFVEMLFMIVVRVAQAHVARVCCHVKLGRYGWYLYTHLHTIMHDVK